MARNMDAANQAALSEHTVRYVFLVELLFDGTPLRFTSAVRSISYGGNAYAGAGTLGSVSPISESTDLNPASCEVRLSGVNQTALSIILGENYLNRPARILVVMIDENDAFVGTPWEYFAGPISSLSITYDKRPTIKLQIKDELVLWNRPKLKRYTDQQQQADHPGDKGFEFVDSIANKEIIWPTAEYLRSLG